MDSFEVYLDGKLIQTLDIISTIVDVVEKKLIKTLYGYRSADYRLRYKRKANWSAFIKG